MTDKIPFFDFFDRFLPPRELRLLLAATDDPEEIWRCKRRIAELTPMLTQMNELAELTAHYYDRGYYRNEKYTV